MIRPGPDALVRVDALAPRRRSRDEEHQLQSLVIQWAALEQRRRPELALLFAVPNWFGTNTRRQGARAKKEGRKAGVPDLVLPVARAGYHACFVEMKTATGAVSPAQRAWHELLRAHGNYVAVCRSAEAAEDVLVAYLDGAPLDTP